MRFTQFASTLLIFLPLVLVFNTPLMAQEERLEPDMATIDPMRSYQTEKIKAGISFNMMVNNFGVVLGGEYRRTTGAFTEWYLTMQISGLRDVSEQSFQFFGQQVVPNKFNRALAIPVMLGYRKRFFADAIADNFRFNLSMGLGPAFVFAYPYFRDQNNNGIRDVFISAFQIQEERINDIFTGWSNGNWHTGLAGEFQIGLDLGPNFKRLNGVKFGFHVYYIPDGIQMMEPFTPVRQNYNPTIGQGDPGFDQEFEPLFGKMRFFATPQITILFGRMW